MGKKRFDHRLLACVARGKCVEGVELPVINPAENVMEGRIDASRRPRKSLAPRQKAVKQRRISDDKIIEVFERWRKRSAKTTKNFTRLAGEGDNSVDMALKMLRDKARLREANKLGAELEDVKDRMVNVVNDYEDLLELSPYSCSLDVEIDQMLENNNLAPWKNAINHMIYGYEDKCRKREEVLVTISQSLEANESDGAAKEEAPSIFQDDIDAVERAGLEIVENLENLQSKTRKLNFLHYSIVKSGHRGQSDEMSLKAHREKDLQKKVVDRFRLMMTEKKNRRSAWKYAADEIVGLLKSVRKEGSHKLEELEASFQKLLETFKGQSEDLEKVKTELRIQKQTVTLAEEDNKRIKDDNLLLQGQLETANKERKMLEQVSSQLKQRLQAHLEEVDDEDLYKPVDANDEEGKEIIYIKRTKKLKANLKQLQEDNEKLKRENSSLQKRVAMDAEATGRITDAATEEDKVDPTESEEKECLECRILGQNLSVISSELSDERDKVKSLEEELFESQIQLQKANQELLQLRIQNSKLVQMSQKVESAGPSSMSLQSSQSIISGQQPYCPPEISNDQLSSADESGYTSHEISTANLEATKKKGKTDQVSHKLVQTDAVDHLNKGVQTTTERVESNKKLEAQEEVTMDELNRMAKEKSFNDEFSGALNSQIANFCNTIVKLTSLVNVIRARGSSSAPESVLTISAANSKEEIPEPPPYVTGNDNAGQPLSEFVANAPTQRLESPSHLQETIESREETSDDIMWQSQDNVGPERLEFDVLSIAAPAPDGERDKVPSVLISESQNIPLGHDNTVSSQIKQEPTPMLYSNTRPTTLAPVNEGVKTKLSIININLPVESSYKTNQKEHLPSARHRSRLLLPTSKSRTLSAKHDFRRSFNKLKQRVEALEEPGHEEQRSNKFSNERKSHVNNLRNNEASRVIKTLRDFVVKSWHHLEVLTGELLEDYSASDADALQEYMQLIAEHAFKILQVIGITIWKISDNEKNSFNPAFMEDGSLKSLQSLPDVFGEGKDEAKGQLITEKSGIWLPMIAVNDKQQPGHLQNFEQPQPSTPRTKQRSQVKQEGLSLPSIKRRKASIMANKTKRMLGIGDHSIASSRSEADQKKHHSTARASIAPRKHQQTDFRSSRILDKNRKLVNLLKQGGKTMNEINVILGLRQGNNETIPEKPTVSNTGNENLIGLGLTSRHISLPKLPSTHLVTSENTRQQRDGSAHFPSAPKSKHLTGPVLLTKKASEGSGLLAFGNSWKKKTSDIDEHFNRNAVQDRKRSHVQPRLLDQQRLGNFIGSQEVPLLSQPLRRPKVEESRPFDASIMPQSRNLEVRNTIKGGDRKMSLAVTGQLGNHLKESLLSHRRQRKMSYSVNHKNITPTLELPNLAVNNRPQLSPREEASGND